GFEDILLEGNVLADNGAGADADLDGDTLSIDTNPVSDVANGTLALLANGDFNYTPDLNFIGTDSFTYTLLDGNGGTDTALVALTVNPVNDNPVAADDQFFVTEDGFLNGVNVLADNGFGFDSDAEGDLLTIAGTPETDAQNGTVTLNRFGFATYKPNPDFNGVDSFTYTLLDGNGGTDTGLVTIQVTPQNDAPVAQPDAFSGDEDTNIAGDVLADNGNGADSDIDGDALTISTTPASDVSNGTLTLNENGTFVYTPDTDFNGTDSFIYTVLDGNNARSAATVTLTVNPVDDGPSNFILGRPGDDIIIGDGRTVISYEFNATGLIFGDLKAGFIGGDASFGRDQVSNIFEVRATPFNDILFGNNTNPIVGGLAFTTSFESFEGLAGADVIFGRDGLDRANYGQSIAGVSVNLNDGVTSNDGFGDVDTLSSIEGLRGSSFGDILVGDAGDNFFQPNSGDNTLDGGGGVNFVAYDEHQLQVNVNLTTGQALHSGGNTDTLIRIQNIEGGQADDFLVGNGEANAIAGGSGADSLFGAAGDDLLLGGAGDDRLHGQAGADTLIGGAGDDAYFVDDLNDIVVETVDGGTDRVVTSLLNFTLFDNIERVDLVAGANSQVQGNLDDNVLNGSTGDNVLNGDGGDDLLQARLGDDQLNGGDGQDRLLGQGGIDTLSGDNGDDLLVGGIGDDILDGGAGRDRLVGNGGDDVLLGGADDDLMVGGLGDDQLTGGGGRDRLLGGAGADTFLYNDITDIGLGQDLQDRIFGFSSEQGDQIDLSGIDANANTGGDDAFTFVRGFTGVAGQAFFNGKGAFTIIALDVDGDGQADGEIFVQGVGLSINDFIL
ncbi:MAG: tandem-95 repeat protein, partial [Alphaproteobacteria bacterium]